MKLSLLLIVLALGSAAPAAEPAPARKLSPVQILMKEADTDKDGKLNDVERAAFRSAEDRYVMERRADEDRKLAEQRTAMDRRIQERRQKEDANRVNARAREDAALAANREKAEKQARRKLEREAKLKAAREARPPQEPAKAVPGQDAPVSR